MAFSDADKFNRITDEIKNLVNWYENTHLNEKTTKVFLSNGESFIYKVPKRQIAHLLGVKTDFLVNTRMLSNTSSYEVLKEFIENDYRFSTKIASGEYKLSDIFSEDILKKLSNFKENLFISVDKTVAVCSYRSDIHYNEGSKHMKCDYIVIQELDDGTVLELDLVINNNTVYPMSNKSYDDYNEADIVFKDLLKNQTVSMLSAIKLLSIDGYYNRPIYQNDRQVILNLRKLKEYKTKYSCHTDNDSDYEHLCERYSKSKNNNCTNDEILDKIIECMMKGIEIQPSKLGLKSTDLTEQHRALINAFNDNIMMGTTVKNSEQKYSSLQKQIKDLKEERRLLEEENKRINNELEETSQKCSRLNTECAKAKVLVKTFKSAINNFENPTE